MSKMRDMDMLKDAKLKASLNALSDVEILVGMYRTGEYAKDDAIDAIEQRLNLLSEELGRLSGLPR